MFFHARISIHGRTIRNLFGKLFCGRVFFARTGTRPIQPANCRRFYYRTEPARLPQVQTRFSPRLFVSTKYPFGLLPRPELRCPTPCAKCQHRAERTHRAPPPQRLQRTRKPPTIRFFPQVCAPWRSRRLEACVKYCARAFGNFCLKKHS